MIEYLPLVTVACTVLLIMHMTHHKRYKQQPQKLLILFLLFACIYALSVFLYVTAPGKGGAHLFGEVALFSIYLAGLMLMLFTLSLRRDLVGRDWLFASIAILITIPGIPNVIQDVRMRYWGWEIVYDTRVAAVYGVLLNTFLFFAAFELYDLYMKLREARSPHAKRTRIILWGVVLYITLGNGLNTLMNLILGLTPPLYSQVLMIPISMIAWSFLARDYTDKSKQNRRARGP